MNGRIECRVSERTGKKSYRAVIYVDKAHGGKGRSYGPWLPREKDAVAWKNDTLGRYQSGTFREPCTLTVAELYAKWRTVRLPDWSENTGRHHAMNWKHHLADEFGDELAEQLTKDRVAEWQAGQLAGGCAPKSVQSYRGTLRAMYEWAIDVELLERNPVDGVKAPRFDRAQHDAVTVAEMSAYLAALRETRLWPGLLIAAGGALRRGEFLAVRWDRLALDGRTMAGQLSVDPQIGNLTGRTAATLRFGPPKTKESGKPVPLTAFAVRELLDLKKRRMQECDDAGLPWDEHALVCCGSDGRPIVPDQFTHALDRFCKRHALQHTHPHAWRHGVIEAMLAAGERLDAVQRIARHRKAQTTLDVYAHVTEAAVAAASERYGSLWEQRPADETPAVERQMSSECAPADELSARRARKRPA